VGQVAKVLPRHVLKMFQNQLAQKLVAQKLVIIKEQLQTAD
jgi:hypothetical protein